MPEDRSAAHDITLPNMTQDEPDCGADLTTQPQGAALVSETSEPLHPPQPERAKELAVKKNDAERLHKIRTMIANQFLPPFDAQEDAIAFLLRQITASEKRAEEAERERNELSADLEKLRQAVRVRPSKKAMLVVRETLEAMEAMDEEDAPALRLLVEMYDKLEARS